MSITRIFRCRKNGCPHKCEVKWMDETYRTYQIEYPDPKLCIIFEKDREADIQEYKPKKKRRRKPEPIAILEKPAVRKNRFDDLEIV